MQHIIQSRSLLRTTEAGAWRDFAITARWIGHLLPPGPVATLPPRRRRPRPEGTRTRDTRTTWPARRLLLPRIRRRRRRPEQARRVQIKKKGGGNNIHHTQKSRTKKSESALNLAGGEIWAHFLLLPPGSSRSSWPEGGQHGVEREGGYRENLKRRGGDKK